MRTWIIFILLAVAVLAVAQGLRNPAFIGSLHYVEAGGAPPASPSSLTTNLVAYWRLDETGSNISRADSVGTNTLTDVNNVQSVTDAMYTNSCYFVSNSLQRLSAVPGPDFSKSNEMWAMCFWSKFIETNVTHQIVGQWSSAYPRDFTVSISSGQQMTMVLNTNGSAGPVVTISPRVTTNVWHMVTLMHDGTNLGFWIDLTKTNVVTGSSLPKTNCGKPLYIGHDGHSGQPYFSGYIDEVAYWKGRVLSNLDVTNLYNSGTGVTYPFTGVP